MNYLRNPYVVGAVALLALWWLTRDNKAQAAPAVDPTGSVPGLSGGDTFTVEGADGVQTGEGVEPVVDVGTRFARGYSGVSPVSLVMQSANRVDAYQPIQAARAWPLK